MKTSLKRWLPVVLILFLIGFWSGMKNRTPYPEKFVGRWVYASGSPQGNHQTIIYQFYYKGVGMMRMRTRTLAPDGWIGRRRGRGGSCRWFVADDKLYVHDVDDLTDTYSVRFEDNDSVMILKSESGRGTKVFRRAYVDWENAGEGMFD